MTQPITSRNPWTPDDATAPPWSPFPAPARDVSELPDAGTALPGGLTSRQPPGVDTSQATTHAAAALVARRLDAFRTLASPTFHTAEGDVTVAIPFRMNREYYGHAAVVAGNAAALASAGHHAGLPDDVVTLVKSGRATPLQITRLTQALINEGRLPPANPGMPGLGQRVRLMMFDYGVGLDCAGYVQQALLAARGVTRANAGLRPPALEDLTALAQRGYVRISVDEARAGDLLILRPPPRSASDPNPVGHTAIVRESFPTTARELDRLARTAGVISMEAAVGGRWTTIVVDSSWGCGGSPSKGGVDRRALWHDAVSNQWVWSADGGALYSGTMPYAHSIGGIYRPAGR